MLMINSELGVSPLGDTGIASHPDRLPCCPPLDGSGALGCRPRSDCPFQLGLLRICGCAQAVGKTGVLGPVHLSLLRSKKTAPGPRDRRFQIGARHAIFQGRTRTRLKSSRASRDVSLRSSSVRLSDGVTTFVERCRLRSAEFPVALLLQSQNRMTEVQSDWPLTVWRAHEIK